MAQKITGIQGVGIDMVDVARFRAFTGDKNHAFLKKTFSPAEIAYCFGHKDPSTHLAGIFAAKEAASKALGTDKFPFIELEIRHDKKGAPEVWRKGKRLAVHVSITHTDTAAAAIAAV